MWGIGYMADKAQKPLWRRVIAFLVFVVVPVGLIGVGVWLARPVVGAMSDYLALRGAYQANVEDYQAQATLAADKSDQGAREIALVGYTRPQAQGDDTPDPPADAFMTNTPAPDIPVTLPAVNTLEPTTAPPTATPIPVEPLVLPTVLLPADAPADIAAPTAIPTRLPTIRRDYDLVNVMLLGSDEEITADRTIRTDTMIIVSINRDTGTVAMMSLPRDLFVYTPGLGMNRLNVTFGWGENVGWEPGGGFGLLRQTILYNFGINVHYYAKVNITEFEQIVNLVGGVEIAVDCAIQDYYPVAPIEELDLTRPIEENYKLRTLDVGYYTFDGFDAQWYARSRRNSSDFDRGRRQQQVVRAIFRKALNDGQLAQLPALWREGNEIVETNMTLNEALSLVPIGLNLESREIESFTLIPTYHTQSWTTPEGDNVQLPVYETLIPFLEDFYTPPSENQVEVRGSTVRVLNGTDKADLDKVAAERLRYSGFAAYADGPAASLDYEQTLLTDFTGQTKGSSRADVADILNLGRGNVIDVPDPNREADFEVILGADYNSCTFGVMPVDEEE